MTTIAYKYGLLEPLDWDQDCHEQLFRMNKLWNTLVEVEHQHRARYRALVGEEVAVATLQSQLDALREEQTALRTERKARRQKARARVATIEQDARLRVLATQIQGLAEQCRVARTLAKESLKEPIRALDAQRFEAVKVARQNSGLWWGNYNAVVHSYEVGRSRAMKDGAELRFRRFNGEGRFTVQIIQGASVEEVTSGTKQVRLDLTPRPIPGRGGKPRPRLGLTLYTRQTQSGRESRLLTFPVILDRPLPETARIQQVVVTRRRVATQWRYAVIFTCRLPDPPTIINVNARACGINLGFRQSPDGLLVGTLWDGLVLRRKCVPILWLHAMNEVEGIQQRRDLALAALHEELRAQWPLRPPEEPQSIAERLGNLVRAPRFSAATLAALVLQWREHPWWPQMLARLEAWRRVDKRDLETQENKREHLMCSRQEQYRLFAREIALSYGHIRIGAINLRRMAQLEFPDGTETDLHQQARRNRTRAALSLLQSEIARQAEKTGSTIEYVEGPVTSTCHRCAGRCAVGADVMHVCEHCSAVWDQDQNAAINAFRSPRERYGGDYNRAELSYQSSQGVAVNSHPPVSTQLPALIPRSR
jgi:Putative transposase DNA-binding domain